MISVLLSCSLSPTLTPPSRNPPDILLVVMDTTRADALMSYGNQRRVGKNVHSLAQKGVLFTQAWTSSSWTWPSHASLFTGLYPWEHGAHFASSEGATALKPDPFYASEVSTKIPTLAQKLKAEGYETVSFSANRLVGPDFNLTKGFDITEFHNDDAKVSTRAQEFLRERETTNNQKPLFMFINLMSAHTPWFLNDEPWVRQHEEKLNPKTAPQWLSPHLLPNGIGVHPFYPNFQESLVFQYINGTKTIPKEGQVLIRDLYEAEVNRSDKHFGIIYEAWNRPTSIVALTSDHGEYLTEHGLLEHGRTLLPEVLHVPLIIKSPKLSPQTIETPVTMHRLHDEILLQAGLETKDTLFSPHTSIYAGAWEDHYWSTSIGSPFDRGYRLQRTNNQMFILDEHGLCTTYTINNNKAEHRKETCPQSVQNELTLLFTDAKTGSSVQPSEQTLEQLKKLGYIGEQH